MFYGWIVRRANCAVYCSPVILVTNYSQFSDLLQNLVKNLMVGQLKANLSQKLSISYKPGNFMGFSDLADINDFSSMISDVVGEGLRSQIGFVNGEMSLANFTGSLNSAAMATLQHELRQKGFDTNDITAVIKNYQRVLASTGFVGTYSGQVNEYRSMVSGFLPVASNLITQMAGLSGKIDVASSISAQQKDVTGNTREVLSECAAHTCDGLHVLGNIGNTSIGDTVGTQFTAANSKYLKTTLGKMATTVRVALTDEETEKIILKVNNAALQTVPQYIARLTNSLEKMSLSTTASVGTIMRTKVQAALEAIHRSATAEKAKEAAITNIYSSIESEVQGLLGNPHNYGTFAREKNPVPLFDNGNMKKIMVLLASRESSATRKKLAVKHYILARTSLEIASSIKIRLNSFDPATVDSGYEDQAWKDLSRLQYYLLYLDNQQLKLMAIRAMAQAADTDDQDILKYLDNSGLPTD
jgi:hypothetical protein